MIDVAYGFDDVVKKWVADRLGYPEFDGTTKNAFGVAYQGKLIGGVVFHNHYPKEGVVEMTAASSDPKWMTREIIRACFGYAFHVLCCQTVVLRVSENNTVMLNIAGRLGFQIYTIPRLRGRTEAECICTLTDDQWRSSRFNRKP